MPVAIYPSLISANLLSLKSVIAELDPHCDGYHIDIMDGHFVPNITWGPAFANAIAQATTKTIWIHLMTTNPLTWINRMELPEGSIVSFHAESACDHLEVIQGIKKKKWKASIALSPNTSPNTIFDLISTVDQVLVMSVHPGFSGQSFLKESLTTVATLKHKKEADGLSFRIGIDGGINSTTIAQTVTCGAQDIAIASGIFSAATGPKNAIDALRKNTCCMEE